MRVPIYAPFQFHKGAIRTQFQKEVLAPLRNFNSIKVRLEHSTPISFTWAIVPFQFHKGAIRTHDDFPAPCLPDNFNSIKVRLEPGRKYRGTCRPSSFQFHKGAIRTDFDKDIHVENNISIP